MTDKDQLRIRRNAMHANALIARAAAYLGRVKTAAENAAGYDSPEYVIALNTFETLTEASTNLNIIINRTKAPAV